MSHPKEKNNPKEMPDFEILLPHSGESKLILLVMMVSKNSLSKNALLAITDSNASMLFNKSDLQIIFHEDTPQAYPDGSTPE
jgi:D-arabinose 5-phosphate isomerase GutQ